MSHKQSDGMQALWMFLSLILLGLAIYLVAVCIVLPYLEERRLETTVGKIELIGTETYHRRGRGPVAYFNVTACNYSYSVEGHTYHSSQLATPYALLDSGIPGSRMGEFQNGSTIKVYYEPGNPAKSAIFGGWNSDLDPFAALFKIGLGGVLALCSASLFGFLFIQGVIMRRSNDEMFGMIGDFLDQAQAKRDQGGF